MPRAPLALAVLAGFAIAFGALPAPSAGAPAPAASEASGACAGGATVDVDIVNFSFSPRNPQVNVGDTIRWTNRDGATHTSTEKWRNLPVVPNDVDKFLDPPAWDSGNLGHNAQFSFQFCAAASFDYQCDIHGFTGTVRVA